MNFRTQSRNGLALVITLLVIVVLTVAVTAFMQSMSLERRTSLAYFNILKSEEAAEAGLQAALQKLVSYDDGSGARLPTPDFHYVISKTSPANPDRIADTMVRLAQNSTAVLSTTELASRTTPAPKVYKFSNLPQPREVDLIPIVNNTNVTVGHYGFYVDAANNKQPISEPAKVTRGFLLGVSELPIIKSDLQSLSAAEKGAVTTFVENPANSSWRSLLTNSLAVNQFATINPQIDDWNAEVNTWTPALNQLGKPRVDLRRLKYYLDNTASLSVSQAPDNPRSRVVDSLLNLAHQNLQSNWGGGDLSWLIDPQNSGRYTQTEARQIVANLMDYIDADIFPTADSDVNPTYMGVEAQYTQVNGVSKLRGHPYINAVCTGVIFNRSTASGFAGGLNSTRVLATLGVVNPWEAETLPWNASYSLEIVMTIGGTASGGTQGNNAQTYFREPLDDPTITNFPIQATGGRIPPNAGFSFPERNSGGQGYANFYSLLTGGPGRQPPGMTFQNLTVSIKSLRLKYISGIDSAYVQILNKLSNKPMPVTPNTISMGTTGGSLIYKFSSSQANAADKTDLHLSSDPRINFLDSSWTLSKTREDTATEKPPVPFETTINVFSSMPAAEGDGAQGLPTDHKWYVNANTNKHFFVRSAELYGNDINGNPYNPATSPYDPRYARPQLAIASVGELGYIFTGRPWQTLRMFQTAASPTPRQDWTLMDSISTGTFPLRDQTSALTGLKSYTGAINPVTARESAIQAILTDVPGLTTAQVTPLVSTIKNIPSANLPFTSIGTLFKDPNVVWPAATTDFAKEELARRIANVLTTRSQVFTVHTYGESLSASGKVAARTRLQATVELVPRNGRLVPKITNRIINPL